jgi:hypothetical protein
MVISLLKHKGEFQYLSTGFCATWCFFLFLGEFGGKLLIPCNINNYEPFPKPTGFWERLLRQGKLLRGTRNRKKFQLLTLFPGGSVHEKGIIFTNKGFLW